MRRSTLTLIAATLFTLPLAAQNPTRPETAPRRPAPAARSAERDADRLTEAQHDRLTAIRNRYAKEARSQREALKVRREKMREEVRGVLTAEQRARLDGRRDAVRERHPAIRAKMAQPRGMREMSRGRGMNVGRGAMAPMRGRMGAPGMNRRAGAVARPDSER